MVFDLSCKANSDSYTTTMSRSKMNPLRSLEVLWIVLFRFPLIPRVWASLLILVNLCGLFFIHTIYGQFCLAAVGAAVVVMAIIYLRMGFVRLLGIGHIFWIPMLIWFALNLPDRIEQPRLYDWLICLFVFNSISLVIDAIDVTRFVRGERQPHFTWK